MRDTKKFKVGDKVRISREFRKYSRDAFFSDKISKEGVLFIYPMLANELTIRKINEHNANIYVKENMWNYSSSMLELISDDNGIKSIL